MIWNNENKNARTANTQFSPLKMKNAILILSLFIGLGAIKAQEVDTFYLHIPISQNDTIIYKRIIQCDKHEHLYHVKDYFENAQIQIGRAHV